MGALYEGNSITGDKRMIELSLLGETVSDLSMDSIKSYHGWSSLWRRTTTCIRHWKVLMTSDQDNTACIFNNYCRTLYSLNEYCILLFFRTKMNNFCIFSHNQVTVTHDITAKHCSSNYSSRAIWNDTDIRLRV